MDIFQASGGLSGDKLFRSLLLLNLGDAVFIDATDGIGLGEMNGTEIVGTGMADIDNDGDLDLLAIGSRNKGHFLYLNNGDGTFTDHSDTSGISDEVSTSLSFGDFDNDGDLDVFFGQNLFTRTTGGFYSNNGNDNHWLRVELVGVRS